ncbi:MAG: hypothetical protein ACTHKG_03265 [Nocardioides sp.]
MRGGDDLSTSNEIMDGTVTSSDLSGGAVGAEEMQNGAVSAEKLRANAQTSLAGGPGTTMTTPAGDTVEQTLVTTTLGLSGNGPADHLVLLTGQFQAAWSMGPGDVVVEWQIIDAAGVAVSPSYRTRLANGEVTTPSVSYLDASAAEGAAKSYSLRARVINSGIADQAVTFTDAVLTAVDLGRK